MIKPRQFLPFLKQNTQGLLALILRGVGVAVLLGISLFLTNFFDPVYVGEYELVRSLLLIGGSLVVLGFDQAILHHAGVLKASQNLAGLRLIYRKMIFMIFLSSLLIMLLVFSLPEEVFTSFFEDVQAKRLVLFTSAGLFFYAVSALNTELFRAYGQINRSELFRGIVKYAPFLIGIILLKVFRAGSYIYLVFLGSFVLLAVISSLLVWKKKEKKSTAVEPLGSLGILKKSFPMAVSSLGFFLLLSIDIIILKKYADYAQVAYYATAVKLVLIVSTVLNTINALFATNLAHQYQLNDTGALKALLKRASRLIFILSLPPLLILLIFPEFILSFFGESYTQAYNALRILALGYLVSCLSGVAAIYLNMTGRARQFQYILLIAVLINLVLNLILIPSYGIEGAAIASGIAIAFWNVCVVVYVYRTDKLQVFLS
ncbi:MATE family efflux transporter [Leeuwenhoekiella parthenopeia]|uniref:Polysaccharide biosynthesis C-terminal domain-containing protein n=1 Tax=Leeuwenhoekiella parthenopeia TaxID=2890320 RepID=A0ABS8GSG3_9FLAO|nr:polysaccharide biosynthesis C-terminal domain-containing protein [Leeuwenhoekiella parthenopeia]MCC4212182.1 polysaccharide biosynthesis C-terminal domain-containing protein [Leeuwenhoekiella parthenopeia]